MEQYNLTLAAKEISGVYERQKINLRGNLTSSAKQLEGGVRGVRIPQNRTEIRVNTAQNNIRKPQTALKLPENF